MASPLVIVGCGGFGRETHDVVDAINQQQHTWDVLGYVDDNPSEQNLALVRRRGSAVLGGTEWLRTAPDEVAYVIGIGSPAVKRAIHSRLQDRAAAVLVHPSAQLGFDVRLGDGTVVCGNTSLTTNIEVGAHVHINPLCNIGHDAVLEDYVSINPMVAVSGWVRVGSGALLGTHSSILQNLSVGEGATVGAAACVVRNVPAGMTVKGVPAR